MLPSKVIDTPRRMKSTTTTNLKPPTTCSTTPVIPASGPVRTVESKEFIAQLATFSQLQGIQSLNATFSESLKLQQLTQGTSLIGKTVDYNLPGGGVSLTGRVDSVSVQDGKYSLVIGTSKIGLDQVTTIR